MIKNIEIGSYIITIGWRKLVPPKWKGTYHSEIGWKVWYGRAFFKCENWTLKVFPVCTQCDSSEIGEVGYEDEGLTVCRDCGAIEQGYKYVNLKEWEI